MMRLLNIAHFNKRFSSEKCVSKVVPDGFQGSPAGAVSGSFGDFLPPQCPSARMKFDVRLREFLVGHERRGDRFMCTPRSLPDPKEGRQDAKHKETDVFEGFQSF